jgi:VanZ family protein
VAWWLWGPPVAVMTAIFVLSSLPGLPAPRGAFTDKHAHFLAYASLAALLFRALAGGRRAGLTLGRGLVAAVLATAYGVTDEWHQSFVPGRNAELDDLAADALGAVVAVGVLWAWSIIGRSRRASAARPPGA